MTKTCSIIATIQRAHYIIAMPIKVIGKFKDEACGVPITELVGLKSKMYCYVKDNEKGEQTTKSIKKCIIKNSIKREDYKITLINNELMHHKMKTIKKPKTST